MSTTRVENAAIRDDMLLLDLIVFYDTTFNQPLIIISTIIVVGCTLNEYLVCLKFKFEAPLSTQNAKPPCLFSKSIHYTHLHISNNTDLFQSFPDIDEDAMFVLKIMYNKKYSYSSTSLVQN